MVETRRKFDQDFREGAVRLVRETGKPIAQVARDLGINEGTLGNWVNLARRRRGGSDGALGKRLTAAFVGAVGGGLGAISVLLGKAK
jgi:transposase